MPRHLRPSPDVVFQELDGEVVLVHLKTNSVYSLNATGARLWELLVAGHDTAQIRGILTEEYEVDPTLLAREVDSLVDDLATENLVSYDE